MGPILGWRRVRWLAIPLVGAVGLSGCGSSPAPPPAGRGHRLAVVAGLFPLAEVARRVGLARVTVTDLTPAGTDPRVVQVGQGEAAGIAAASVVLVIGEGYQPAVERAAAHARDVVSVLPAVGGGPVELWLDPLIMAHVAGIVADALSRADPAGRAAYRQGARAFSAQLGALDIDYRSSLADCGRHDLVTADDAFRRLASRYGLREYPIIPAYSDPRRLADLLRLVTSGAVTTIFIEPAVSARDARDLARRAGKKVEELATLAAPPADPTPRQATYVSLMTDDLAKLRRALACTSGSPT